LPSVKKSCKFFPRSNEKIIKNYAITTEIQLTFGTNVIPKPLRGYRYLILKTPANSSETPYSISILLIVDTLMPSFGVVNIRKRESQQ
jgi:hypothetical protein